MPEAAEKFTFVNLAPDGSRVIPLRPSADVSPEAMRAAGEQVARERERSFEASRAFEKYSRAPLPPASELPGCDVAGLSPERGDLVCLFAWQAKLTAEAVQRRGELDALKAKTWPAADRTALEAFDRDEGDRFAAWVRGGSKGARPAARERERSALVKVIDVAEWEGRVVRDAIHAAEMALAEREGAAKALRERQAGFVAAVLDSSGAPIKAEIDALMAGEVADLDRDISSLHQRMDGLGQQLAGKYRCLLALAMATGRPHQGEMAIVLPHRPPVMVKALDCAAAAAAWTEFARQLEADPRAQSEVR